MGLILCQADRIDVRSGIVNFLLALQIKHFSGKRLTFHEIQWASLWFSGRTLFYSILRFAAAQSPLSNCKQSPYWILFCPLRIDTPTFQTKNKQLKLSFLIDFPQKYDL